MVIRVKSGLAVRELYELAEPLDTSYAIRLNSLQQRYYGKFGLSFW